MRILPILKFVYRGLLTGLPSLTYNPFTKLNFHSPFSVLPYSTYINYKLDSNQFEYINNYLLEKNSSLVPEKISMENFRNKNYFMSVNIYNCSVPIIPSDSDVTRCEINTYVKDKVDGTGTLILDYVSNALSMDPVNIFKMKDNITFIKDKNDLNGYCSSENIDLDMRLKIKDTDSIFKVSDNLIDYSDKIFYLNSIYDKLFYDTSLTRAKLLKPSFIKKLYFRFGNLTLSEPDSVFYFKNNIKFAGSIWHNLYTIDDF